MEHLGCMTIRRLLTNDFSFRTERAEARRAMFLVGVARAQALSSRAVEVLEELVDREEAPFGAAGRCAPDS